MALPFSFILLIGLGKALDVESCENKICQGVNLSESVVILNLDSATDDDHVLKFKDNTDAVIATLEWSKQLKILSVKLLKDNKEMVNPFNYNSIPDSSDQYSFGIIYHMLNVYKAGYPIASWNISTMDMPETHKTSLAEDINLEFSSASNPDYMVVSDRCPEGHLIDRGSASCHSCKKQLYGSGFTESCVDIATLTEFCEGHYPLCRDVSYCDEDTTMTPYGSFTWPISTVNTNTRLALPCLLDTAAEDTTASRVCAGNRTWGEVDSSDCVKSSVTDSLAALLASDVSSDSLGRKLLQTLEDVPQIGRTDILIIYDLITELITPLNSLIPYQTAVNIVNTLNYLLETGSCQEARFPGCHWIAGQMRGVVPRLQNHTILIIADNIGMFHMEEMTNMLDVYTFCQHTFHDMITGCSNDKQSFLQVVQGELKRLLQGSKANNMAVSLVFLNDDSLYPAKDVSSVTQLNDTISNFTPGGVGVQSIGSMVVDLAVRGIPDDTPIKLLFSLYNSAQYSSNNRKFHVNSSIYVIKYECAYYVTESEPADMFLTETETSLSLSSKIDLAKLVSSHPGGRWEREDCETTYDNFSDNPPIRCLCKRPAGAFTVLVTVRERELPEYYVEILVGLAGTCLLGVLIGLVIIFMPAKTMGIPKAAKFNVAIIMILLVVTLCFLLNKIVKEFDALFLLN